MFTVQNQGGSKENFTDEVSLNGQSAENKLANISIVPSTFFSPKDHRLHLAMWEGAR